MQDKINSYKIESFFLQTNEEKEAFFTWCLKKKLYKEDDFDGPTSFLSRMKKVYEGFKETEKAMAVVSFKNGNPVAIALLEFNHKQQLASVIKKDARTKLGYKVLKEGPFSIHHVGFISLYVKESHRSQGLAKNLFNQLEEKVATELIRSGIYQQNDVMAYQCLEKALEIAQKNAVWGYPMHISPISSNFRSELGYLADEVMIHRMGEESYRKNKMPIRRNLEDLKQSIVKNTVVSKKSQFAA